MISLLLEQDQPVQMMAARAADFILGRPQLNPIYLEYST